MTQANYPRCLANTLNEEGGYSNDAHDPGGPTMRGIIQREYDRYRDRKGRPRQSVRYIAEDELQDIYAGNYWNPMRGDAWPKGPDQIVFDIAVNSGTGRAPQIMGAALGTNERSPAVLARMACETADKAGLVKRACARRAGFYRALGTFQYFGRGWLARNARMEAIGVRMCLEAQGVVDIAGRMQREQQAAATKSKRAGQGAAGSGGLAGGTGTGALAQSDPSAWDWTNWLALGLSVLAFAALIVALWWAWKKHGERAKAYLASARGELETELATVLAKLKAGAEAFEKAGKEAA